MPGFFSVLLSASGARARKKMSDYPGRLSPAMSSIFEPHFTVQPAHVTARASQPERATSDARPNANANGRGGGERANGARGWLCTRASELQLQTAALVSRVLKWAFECRFGPSALRSRFLSADLHLAFCLGGGYRCICERGRDLYRVLVELAIQSVLVSDKRHRVFGDVCPSSFRCSFLVNPSL